ncbi:MAG: TlpA disulfide reductase family protein [Methyloglobulus sp.]|nr:TlpA family protein disulfide reductase [Methyloglobulus sp.]
MKNTILIVTVAAIALIGGMTTRQLLSAPITQASQTQLPEFSLPDLSGKQHSMTEWQGKVRVINFWATWCPPCLKEMPEFTNLQKQFADQGLQFIGIALDDSEPVKEFVNSNKINYPILLGQDQGTKIAHSLGNLVDTVPFTVIIDKQGMIVKSKMGVISRDELVEIVKPLL